MSYERYAFRRITQEQNESFQAFVERLQCQKRKCNFRSPDEHLFDQIVEKCSMEELRREVFRSKLSLDELICKGLQMQSARSDQQTTSQDNISCTRCGFNDHSFRSLDCPALTSNCLGCGKRGHYYRFCRTAKVSPKTEQRVRFESLDKTKIQSESQEEKQNETENSSVPQTKTEKRNEESEKNQPKSTQITDLIPSTSGLSTDPVLPSPQLRLNLMTYALHRASRKTPSPSSNQSEVPEKRVKQNPTQALPEQAPGTSGQSSSNTNVDYVLSNWQKRRIAHVPARNGKGMIENSSAVPLMMFDSFVGGMNMKLIVKESAQVNVMSKAQFRAIRSGPFTYLTAEPLEMGGYCGQLTAKVKVGHETATLSIFVKEDHDEFIYINAKSAETLKLVQKKKN